MTVSVFREESRREHRDKTQRTHGKKRCDLREKLCVLCGKTAVRLSFKKQF